MKSDKTHVSVIVAARNCERTIGKCIGSLINQNYPRSMYEIIIVDDGSTDRTVQVIKKYPVKLIQMPWSGETAAYNAALKIARGEVIMITNADCYVGENWIRKHLLHYLNDKTIVAVGGFRIEIGDDFTFATNPIILTEPFLDIPLAFNCSFKRTLINDIGLFDTEFSYRDALAGEVEFFLRGMLKGYKMLVDPTIIVYHDHPAHSLPNVIRRAIRGGKGAAKAIIRHYPSSHKYFAKIFLMAFGFFPVFLVYVMLTQFFETLTFRKQFEKNMKKSKLSSTKIWLIRTLSSFTYTLAKGFFYIRYLRGLKAGRRIH